VDDEACVHFTLLGEIENVMKRNLEKILRLELRRIHA
jgi:hypothetical protein